MTQVLRQLPRSSHPDLLVGHEHFDDAGVFRIRDDFALVQTLDFFPPLVDDPFTFGRIAAANALSDVYAMGGEPLTAMNIVGFPDKELPMEILGEILRGSAERVETAGAVVVGGHSVRDAEIKFGLSVTGWVHPQKIWTNAGAIAGDALLLTKPIGSGVLTTAFKKGWIGESDLVEAMDWMVELNKTARDVAVEIGIHTATDITGFGLLGHAFEVADASRCTIRLFAESIPLMNQTLDLARRGAITRACQSTLGHLGARLGPAAMEPALVNLLADAQTSGGLLLAVAPDRADALLEALRFRNVRAAAIIGEVSPPSQWSIELV